MKVMDTIKQQGLDSSLHRSFEGNAGLGGVNYPATPGVKNVFRDAVSREVVARNDGSRNEIPRDAVSRPGSGNVRPALSLLPSARAVPPEHPLSPSSAGASFHGMAGRSPAMRRFFGQLQITAPYLRLAAIEGENGSGKTLAARTLHFLGPFAKEAFVSCVASVFLAEEHAGLALPWCPAVLRQASGGMLFLDRVDELDPKQQSRLFQFLLWFDNQRPRAGSSMDTPRQVVVSTTTSLRRMAASDALRGDLCSRLTAIRYVLPALRERREDIPLLAQHFAQQFSQTYRKQVRGLTPEALPPLLRYSWPGNVRELESIITSAALQTDSQWIRPIDLPVLVRPALAEAQAAEDDFNLDHMIARHVKRTLERTHGNKLRAALILGISRSTLYRILGTH